MYKQYPDCVALYLKIIDTDLYSDVGTGLVSCMDRPKLKLFSFNLVLES